MDETPIDECVLYEESSSEEDILHVTRSLNADFDMRLMHCTFMCLHEGSEHERMVRVKDYLATRQWIERNGYLKKYRFRYPQKFRKDGEAQVVPVAQKQGFIYSHEIYPDMASLYTAETYDKFFNRITSVKMNGGMKSRAKRRAAKARTDPDNAPPCGPTTWRWACSCDWCVGTVLKVAAEQDHTSMAWRLWAKEHFYLMHLCWLYGIYRQLPANVYRYVVHLTWSAMIQVRDFERDSTKPVTVPYIAPARLVPTTKFKNGATKNGKKVWGSKRY